jgi:hypothetical protein
MRKLLRKYGFLPENLVTDYLRFYPAAARNSLDCETRLHVHVKNVIPDYPIMCEKRAFRPSDFVRGNYQNRL